MRKIILYIAASLNGKIAEIDGSVSWLERLAAPENSDYGYAEFYKSIDTTIQGCNTYRQIMSWDIDFPYKDKKNYVITRKSDMKDTEYVEFISEDHIPFIEKLKHEDGSDIWLIGGGQVNALLLDAGLIDKVIVFVMPIILKEGIEIFEHLANESRLKLASSKRFATGAMQLEYTIIS